MEAGTLSTPVDGRSLEQPSAARLPDRILRWGLTTLAVGIFVLLAFFFIRLFIEARPALSHQGVFGFTFDNNWDVSREVFGALPLVVGTLITSALALAIGAPIAVATAVYLVELCPPRLKQPLTIMVELLAAVPSVVYGLWGVYVLIPKLLPAEKWFADTFHWIPFIGGGSVAGPNYFIRGGVLALLYLFDVSLHRR